MLESFTVIIMVTTGGVIGTFVMIRTQILIVMTLLRAVIGKWVEVGR